MDRGRPATHPPCLKEPITKGQPMGEAPPSATTPIVAGAMSKKPLPPPVYRSPSGRYFMWARMVRDARRRPGLWFLALPAVPLATVRAVREQRHVDLKLTVGRLEAEARNPYIHEGRSMCDLWIRYTEETP